MKSERKLHLGNSIPRFIFVGLSLLFQVGWILLTILFLNEQYPWIELLTRILSVTVVLQMNSKQTDAAYKMPWIMLILVVPVMGLSLYVMLGLFGDLGSIGKRMHSLQKSTRTCLEKSEESLQKLMEV